MDTQSPISLTAFNTPHVRKMKTTLCSLPLNEHTCTEAATATYTAHSNQSGNASQAEATNTHWANHMLSKLFTGL